jgi:hypothetical protein
MKDYGCLVFVIVFVTFINFNCATSTEYEAELLRDWAVNYTRNHGWNVTNDPCTWAGVTCATNESGTYTEVKADPYKKVYGVIGDVVGIDIDPLVLNRVMYGEFPDLDLWASAKVAGTAFTKLRWLTFQWFRFGPTFPDTIHKYWTNYNDSIGMNNEPFNVLLTNKAPLAEGNAAPSLFAPFLMILWQK